MADKRMPADAARQMLESEKRKVQKQAVNMGTREEYRGFRLPPNMSAEETERYKAAIDERENFGSKAARQLPQQAEDYVIEPIKGVGRSAADVGKSLLEATTVVPRTKAAIAADPEGAREFAKSVLSGDREAIRTAATEASEGAAEPFATMGDAALSLDAAERGEFGEAAGYAGLVVLPGVLQTLGKSMSKGWLKSAAEAGEEIPDEAAKKLEDLAKRVDEGKITDDMQVRRELARVEDTYKTAYKGGEDAPLDLMNVRNRTAGISEGTQALDAEINAFQQSELGNKLLRGSDQDFDRYTQMMEQIKAKYPDEVVKAETYGIRGLPVTRLTVEEVENAGSNTIAKQFVGTRLAQDVLAQLDNVPNKNLDNITSGKTVFGEYAEQYGELLDLSNLSDEQLELLRKRHASVSSPELGSVASFKLERGTAGYYSKPSAEVEDARDRLIAIGEAVNRERTKRADIEHLKFKEYVQNRIDASKKGELE